MKFVITLTNGREIFTDAPIDLDRMSEARWYRVVDTEGKMNFVNIAQIVYMKEVKG